MKVKIKNGEEMIDATIEMVDGVMVVSPNVEKCDIAKFNDGDIITCGHNDCGGYSWTCILHGEIECIYDMFIDDYCSLDSKGEFIDHNSGAAVATWVRYATEEEKQKLFDKLKEEGLAWDAEKKEIIKLKWKPVDHEKVYVAGFTFYGKHPFCPFEDKAYGDSMQWRAVYERGWFFKTEEECQEFCNRLNDAINQVKP